MAKMTNLVQILSGKLSFDPFQRVYFIKCKVDNCKGRAAVFSANTISRLSEQETLDSIAAVLESYSKSKSKEDLYHCPKHLVIKLLKR